MNKSVFFLISLLLVALCSTSLTGSFDTMIDSLVELNQKVGKDAVEIGVLVSRVEDSLKITLNKFSKFSDNVEKRCKQGEADSKKFEDTITEAILESKTKSHNAEKELTAVVKAHKDATESVVKGVHDLKELESKVKSLGENVAESRRESEEKLQIIKTLRDIVTDELLAPAPEHKGKSFIQMETFSNKLNQLKSLLKNMGDASFTPLTAALVAITEGRSFSDAKILNQILAVLKKLEVSLLEFNKKADGFGFEELNELKKQVGLKGQQIALFRSEVAKKKSEQLALEHTIATAKTHVESLNRSLERKKRESHFWAQTCSEETNYSNKQRNVFKVLEGGVANAKKKVAGLKH